MQPVPPNLTWSFDQEPGIRRRRAGRGFAYYGPEGELVRDVATLERIRKLVIPPAWESVWIALTDNGHIQATGRDARGRKQYIYHPEWRTARDATKFHRMEAFGRALPAIREQVAKDLARRTLDDRRVVAGVVRLLDLAAIRVGTEQYAQENKSFGLTTLRCRHASVLGETIRLDFTGKGGKRHSIEVCDRKVARVIRDCSELPGQVLFQYVSEGERRRVRSHDVNAYLKEASGGDFTAKDFRTWVASVMAARLLAEEPVATTKTEAARRENAVTAVVAERLGNTRTVCRNSYIFPGVYECYRDGTLAQGWARNRSRWQSQGSEDERLFLWLLGQSKIVQVAA